MPLLLIHGTADPFAPYQGSAQIFADAPAPKFFVTLICGPHIRFGPPWESVAARSQIDFFDRYPKRQAGELRQLQGDTNAPNVVSLQQAPTQ